MQEFKGKVAVVTGAASGMGRGLAERFAREGMKVVLADVEKPALNTAVEELQRQGFDVIGQLTDVSQLAQVEALRDRTLKQYGKVHILCNNAGVVSHGATAIWDSTMHDWEWVLGVNLWGVINGVNTFLPIMIEQDEAGHVVNNSSVHGIMTGAGEIGPYSVSKVGVTRITEALYYDLARINSKLKCTLLCPSSTATNLDLAGRNRPDALKDRHGAERQAEIEARGKAVFLRHQSGGMAPSEVADHVFNAIKAEQFYLITEPNPASLVRIKENVRVRMESILAERNLPPETTPR
jgi:NAD(P)-dependent dehydrogenase (short-subunit alcohol dehydrogenase family)